MNLVYKPPGPVARAFMRDDSFVRGLRGPVGSGKSVTCIMEIMRRIIAQAPNAEGKRKSRWAIIRNTNPMLASTTIKTYEDWFQPEHWGTIKMGQPPWTHEINLTLPDRTQIEAEVLFLALDRPEDMRKLLSLELTGAFINEAREVTKSIVDGVTQRLRRYPSQRDGGASWSGLIMDTNAPDDDHWWPIMAGDVPPPEGMSDDDIRTLVKPENWRFFNQPGGMREVVRDGKIAGYEVNPEAENIANLDPAYYPGQLQGKTKAYIDVYLMNRLGATHDGRPVHPDFKREVHVAAEPIEPIPGVPIIADADFGLTPAGHLFQRVRDRYLILREIVLTDSDAQDFGRAVNRVMLDQFPGHKLINLWGDPAGDQRAGTIKNTPFQVLRNLKIAARPVETNDPEIRRGALRTVLRRMVGGEPGILFDPSCKVTIAGLEGAWCYKRVRGANGETFEDTPSKNRYSHPCEALEYGMVGCGEARAMLGRKAPGEGKTVNVRAKADPLDRFKQQRQKAGGASWRR